MKVTYNNGVWTIDTATRSVDLTSNEVSILVKEYMKHGLRASIIDRLHEADGDTIDIERYPYDFDELVDEVYTDLEEDIDNDEYPNDDDIDDKIADVAQFYEMELD